MRIPIPPPAHRRPPLSPGGAPAWAVAAGLAPVWRNVRRFSVDRRNAIPRVEVDDDGLVTIRCGADEHVAAPTQTGRFGLQHHDVEAEVGLLVLGASLPACLLYALVWSEAVHDAEFLSQWADDPEGERLTGAAEDWRGNYWEGWPSEPPAARALFGPRLQHLAALAAAQRMTRRAESWAVVQRAVQRRARRAFVASLATVDGAHRRPDALVPVTIRLGPGPPAVEGRLAEEGSGVVLRLSPEWLWSVWGAGGALLDGRLVVGRDGASPLVVRWQPTGGLRREHVPVVEVFKT